MLQRIEAARVLITWMIPSKWNTRQDPVKILGLVLGGNFSDSHYISKDPGFARMA